jgi:uncharacterized membrane protein YraQ (UPF0718 family)
MSDVLHLLNGGAGNLAAYLAAHVLLCLLPAFFIAGSHGGADSQGQHHALARTHNAATHVSYPAAAAAGSLLAVCSCTIVPLFAGIYRKGAGIGPAIDLPLLRAGGQHHGAGLHRQHPGAGVRHRARSCCACCSASASAC